MTDYVETVIVGGGQAGLAVSYHLTQQGRAHTILEQASQPAEAWRNHRWDSFTLVTPNWTVRMPGAEYQGDDPDGFMTRNEVVAYLETHRTFQVANTVRCPGDLSRTKKAGYLVRADETTIETANVVIATGLFQRPRIPLFSANLPVEVQQRHTSEYRNPTALPPGAVLVVGSAQSGSQIAEELYQSGRKVYLCVGGAGRGPRRYRGKDITWWMNEVGFNDVTVDMLPSPKAKFGGSAQVSGKDGGHTINLHQFARDGVVLLGRMQAAQGGKITFAPDLKENLAKADKLEADLLRRIDDYIETNGLDVPQ
jgi:putative flavoprotein involved in K+ transport